MAEKSFRQIEAEIKEKGFAALLEEAATEIQNITRLLGYIEEQNEGNYDVCKLTKECTAYAMRAGIDALKLSKLL